MNVNDYDLTSGFVLSNEQALDYLEACAKCFYEQAIDTGEEVGAIIDDLVGMAHAIKVERTEYKWALKYEWVLFSESPMSASGIMIKPMVEKE